MKQRWQCGVVGALALGMAFGAAAQSRPLNDSGQTACYSDSATTGTVGVGTPDPEAVGFNEQDCSRGRAAANAVGVLRKVGASSAPGRDYTKIANDGSDLPASAVLGSAAGDWGCTRDNLTGLIWEIKTDDDGLRDKDHSYTWYDSDNAINGGNAGTLGGQTCGSRLANCNTDIFRFAVNFETGAYRLCGQTDWRLPTVMELQSLVHRGATSPAIDVTYFPNTLSGNYWSGVNQAANPADAWFVNFNGGGLYADPKSLNLQVRLVRGGQ